VDGLRIRLAGKIRAKPKNYSPVLITSLRSPRASAHPEARQSGRADAVGRVNSMGEGEA
jgi:hypothetical protein